MTLDDIDKLTIGEVRAIAERAGAALEQLHRVQALLGGAMAGSGSALLPRPSHAPPQLTAEEMAQREALLRRNRDDGLPEVIKRAEGIS